MYARYFEEVLGRLPPSGVTVEGNTLRHWLNESRSWLTRWSRAQFYHMMMEMEDAGIVEGHWSDKTVGGQTLAVRVFRRKPLKG